MCGLVFQYDALNSPERVTWRIRSALEAIYHRGPDELRVHGSESAYFAHARLSIVDIATSKQPMSSADGRYTIVFNGEIYNYRELRSLISEYWKFQTSGDTETLLAGLILEGVAFLSKLEGMWAFALWDSVTQTLILSRDRMGKKPLYYTEKSGVFSCASELPALKVVAGGSWSEDIDSAADYFRYGFCLPGFTMFDGVYEVKPAHFLTWRAGEPVKEEAYWSLRATMFTDVTYNDDDLRNALHEAVRKRLVADVEVGGFLSGGIDSSLVCSIAQSLISSRLKTYTIGFTESSFDESEYAAYVARTIGSEHQCETFDSWDESYLESLILNHVGQPYADASLLPTSLVSERAARDVKVVLSGDGADELFGGYQRYQAQLIFRWYTRLPVALRACAKGALRALPTPMVHHSGSLLKKAQLFIEAAERYGAESRYTAPSLFSPPMYASLFPDLRNRGHRILGLTEETELEDLQQMLFSDCLVYLPQDILTKVDRASMSHSLEVRSPFLDRTVIEIAFSRAAKSHLGLGKGKKWLRQAFSDDLPESIWNRRKQGFGVPLNKWFCGELGDRLLSHLDEKDSMLNRDYLRKILRAHRLGKGDYSMSLWAVYVYLSAVKR